MTRIRDYHRRVDADRQAKKAELDPSRVPGLPAAVAPAAPAAPAAPKVPKAPAVKKGKQKGKK